MIIIFLQLNTVIWSSWVEEMVGKLNHLSLLGLFCGLYHEIFFMTFNFWFHCIALLLAFMQDAYCSMNSIVYTGGNSLHIRGRLLHRLRLEKV